MLQRAREPFGKAGLIVAVIALVAGLAGGAYAAGGLTAKQNKEVKKIAKQFAGQDGQQGPAGPAGPQGAKGDAGAPGANGVNGKDGTNGEEGKKGKDGESVNVIPLSSGDANCPQGGAKFTNLTGSAYACSAASGGGGGELPEILAGYWEVQGESGLVINNVFTLSEISFVLPLEVAPTEALLINSNAGEPEKDKCPGSPAEPKATPGVLCLYESFGPGVAPQVAAVTKFGANLLFAKTVQANGSWAVNTEAPGP